jgi:hypothetical protein
MELLDAEDVYVLMTCDFRVSRNARIKWFLHNLSRTITVQKREDLVSSTTATKRFEECRELSERRV